MCFIADFPIFAAILGNRARMGIPRARSVVNKTWLNGESQKQRKVQNEDIIIDKKFPEIPKLEDYNKEPPESFWKCF
jgi:hypothetical protein